MYRPCLCSPLPSFLPHTFCLFWGGLFLRMNLGHTLYPVLPSWFQASCSVNNNGSGSLPCLAPCATLPRPSVCVLGLGGARFFSQCPLFFRSDSFMYSFVLKVLEKLKHSSLFYLGQNRVWFWWASLCVCVYEYLYGYIPIQIYIIQFLYYHLK